MGRATQPAKKSRGGLSDRLGSRQCQHERQIGEDGKTRKEKAPTLCARCRESRRVRTNSFRFLLYGGCRWWRVRFASAPPRLTRQTRARFAFGSKFSFVTKVSPSLPTAGIFYTGLSSVTWEALSLLPSCPRAFLLVVAFFPLVVMSRGLLLSWRRIAAEEDCPTPANCGKR